MATKCLKCNSENLDDSVFCAKCGTQIKESEEKPIPTQTLEVPKEELTTGSTFAGRYQIIEELGRGGMGRVYKATDTKIKEKVALKLIKPEIAYDKKTLERFGNELRIARKITHKNVGKMFDINEDEGIHYITMEYVSGQDLKGFIRQSGQMGVGTAISVIKQVCEGLSEAHKMGVIHRDLKPSNVMIDQEGNVKIMDFGIARSLKEKGITGAGVMIGTPDYMSPEQAEAKELDQRSDIYSLGVIMYEMVTGRVPFEGDTALSIAMRHKSEAPKDPKEYNAQIPDDLNKLILKCLEKDKESRYQSAGEIQSELENTEKGIPTTDRAIPRRKPLTSKEITVTFGLKKLLIPASILVALIVVTLVLWHPWSQREVAPVTTDKPSLAILYFKNNTGDESLDHWRSALSDWLITDLTQSKYIKVLRSNRIYTILQKLDLLEAENYTSEDIRAIASEGEASHILLGSLSKAGDTLRLDYELQNSMTGELVGSDSVSGNGEAELPNMVDETTRLIKANLNLTLAQIQDDRDLEIGSITTSSPEAFKYAREAVRLNWQGELQRGIQLLERAIALDPEFATAYSYLGALWANLGYKSRSWEYEKKAFELRDRLPEDERFGIEGDYYAKREKTYDKAIEAYNKALQFYPDDLMILRAWGLC